MSEPRNTQRTVGHADDNAASARAVYFACDEVIFETRADVKTRPTRDLHKQCARV